MIHSIFPTKPTIMESIAAFRRSAEGACCVREPPGDHQALFSPAWYAAYYSSTTAFLSYDIFQYSIVTVMLCATYSWAESHLLSPRLHCLSAFRRPVPRPPALLLCAHSIDTNPSCSQLLFDGWLLARLDEGDGARLLLVAVSLPHDFWTHQVRPQYSIVCA